MKKNFNKGFVLAETLVVTVFLLAIFAMIYSDYFPLIGEFEKREVYDDVDSKYGVFWIKRLIEDPSYNIKPGQIKDDPRESNKINKKRNYAEKGYFRFECSDINDPQKRETCASLVNALEIAGCDATTGDNCDIYVTKYQIGTTETAFKDTVATNQKHQSEECFAGDCKQLFITSCIGNDKTDLKRVQCTDKADKNVFTSGFQDYIFTLPDYKNSSLNGAQYRVFAVFKHKRDNNDYFSYATIEVNK